MGRINLLIAGLYQLWPGQAYLNPPPQIQLIEKTKKWLFFAVYKYETTALSSIYNIVRLGAVLDPCDDGP